MNYVSELIERLQRIQNLYGDIEIYGGVSVEVLPHFDHGEFDKDMVYINR